ncbi:MAG: type II toxin-antitoxin system VapC family toxin [Caldilineaceae bacterium]|nr:type II toxin-antitoxin system VapC family toxin [Caldilineaceae bacterium]MDE0080758.1 type II toxin-antitoxin system VapC family toxin [Caldilineaceae bacterium]
MTKSMVCVDANVFILAFLGGQFSEQANELFRNWNREKIALIAPHLLAFEVTSTLRRLVFLGEITPQEGEEAFKHFLTLDIQLFFRREVVSIAWQYAHQFNRPRAYDTAYLAVAHLNNCEFWTADRRLYRAVTDSLPWVKCLQDNLDS